MEQLRMKILYSRDEIDRVVREMAGKISRDFEGKELVVVCVLKGAFMFMADLVRHLKVPASSILSDSPATAPERPLRERSSSRKTSRPPLPAGTSSSWRTSSTRGSRWTSWSES